MECKEPVYVRVIYISTQGISKV